MPREQISVPYERTNAALQAPLPGSRTARASLRLAGLAAVLTALLYVLTCAPAAAEDATKEQRHWWIDHYGLVDARTEPLVARAEEVFSRVSAAADKKGNRLPKLTVIGGKGDPYALTLRDGTIILTLGCLKICYSGVSPAIGDSRLAFLIGHELAHLAKDDFWHSSAYAAVSSNREGTDVRRALASQLEKTGGSLDFVKTQELQADSYGIISMTMAGYDPTAVIGQDDENFFQYWTAQTAGDLPEGDAVHVPPEARTEFVRTELQPVIDALPRFGKGMQFYRNGDYRSAAAAFESFIEKYPGREVYNNLGLCRYQLAMKSLSACNAHETGFKLPTVLDPETTAQRLGKPNAGEDVASVLRGSSLAGLQDAGLSFDESEKSVKIECFQDAAYLSNLQEAIRFFDEAIKKDAAYLPPRINLSTALILSGDHAKAVSVADGALGIDPNSLDALYNKSVAEHIYKKKHIAPPPDRVWAGLTADLGNTSIGASVVWWLTEHYGLQASSGGGTFTSYAIRGLARFNAIWILTPYVGLGYLSVERKADVHGVPTTFSGKSGEVLAGAVLPLSARSSLLSTVSANAMKLDKTVSVRGQDLPVTMTYSPVTATVTLVYAFK